MGIVKAVAVLAATILLGLMFGATDQLDWNTILDLRLPRVMLAVAVGAGLAVSGAVLQALFTNPLCEPYTLGISSGAALGAVLGSALGMDLNFAGMTGTGFIGALFFTFLLFGVTLHPGANHLVLLLSGVMLQFLGSSLVAVWMALADPNGIQGAVFWLMGDLSRARTSGALISLFAVVILVIWVWFKSRSLDAFLMGEQDAISVGVPVAAERRKLMTAAALLVGLCVSASGMIGFVGLVIPHLVRRRSGALHRMLIPACALWGAAALTGADLLGRVLARPHELPVGVVTALAGSPVFFWILFSRSRGGRGA